jgi:hypothetical protein
VWADPSERACGVCGVNALAWDLNGVTGIEVDNVLPAKGPGWVMLSLRYGNEIDWMIGFGTRYNEAVYLEYCKVAKKLGEVLNIPSITSPGPLDA